MWMSVAGVGDGVYGDLDDDVNTDVDADVEVCDSVYA